MLKSLCTVSSRRLPQLLPQLLARSLWGIGGALLLWSGPVAAAMAMGSSGSAAASGLDSWSDAEQVFYESGHYEDALRLLKQRLADVEQTGQTALQAAVLGNMALVYQALGQPQKAQNAIEQAQALSSAATDAPQTLSGALFNIQGQLHFQRGQAEAALENWKQAEKAYQQVLRSSQTRSDRAESQDHQRPSILVSINQTQINQAQALQQLGFYGRALKQLESLKGDIEQQPDNLTKVAQLRALGEAFQLTGDAVEAEATLQQALTLIKSLSTNAAATASERQTSNLIAQETAALHLSLGNGEQAERQFKSALAQYQKAEQVAPTSLLKLQAQVNQLTVQVARREWDEVEKLVQPIQQNRDKTSPSLDSVYAQLQFAQGLMQLPQPQRRLTAEVLAKALDQAKVLGDRRSQSYALGYLGQLYQQTNQTTDALKLTQQALNLAERMEAPEIRYRWHWQLGQLLKQVGERESAIGAYDAAIADLKVLRGDLAAVNRDIQFSFRESVEPVYRESVALLLENSSEPVASALPLTKTNAKDGSILGRKLTPAQKVRQANLDKARQRMEDLQLAELDNFFREACLDSQTVLLDKVVDQDNPTAAVIYPIILEDRMEVIVKIPQQPLRQYSLKQSQTTVEEVARKLQKSLRTPDETYEVRQLAKQLNDWFMAPIEQDLAGSDVDTLVFVLDGPLRNIPMSVLYDGEQYLVEKYAVALSLGLQLIDPKPLAQDSLEVLAAGLADPPEDYRRQFAPLPQVSEEIAEIGQTVTQSKQLLNQEFTRQQFEDSVNGAPFNVVHLATHGQFSSDADKTFVLAADGPIKVNQFDDVLRQRATRQASPIELLVLSACQTASGDDRATLGLAGVAVRAGARSTLASLWNIGDRSTSILIGDFYRELAEAEKTNQPISKAEALRRAQLKLLQSDEGFDRPYSWAPYVLVGNWL